MQPFAVMTRGRGVGFSDGEIYSKHKDDLIRYATALVGPDDAEDVVASVVLRVLRRGRLSGLVEPRPYLFRAVLNESRGVMRKRITTFVASDIEGAAAVGDPGVLDAVLQLPVRQYPHLETMIVRSNAVCPEGSDHWHPTSGTWTYGYRSIVCVEEIR